MLDYITISCWWLCVPALCVRFHDIRSSNFIFVCSWHSVYKRIASSFGLHQGRSMVDVKIDRAFSQPLNVAFVDMHKPIVCSRWSGMEPFFPDSD